jgi:hypothetical protein
MFERKELIAKLLAFLFVIAFTIYDIWIVEGVFAPLQIWDAIHIYHQATYSFLIPLLIIFISLGLKSWRFLVYSVIGIYCGWLDILYFLFQFKTLPDVYTWLFFSPNSFQLVAFAITTLIVASFIDWVAPRISLKIVKKK